MFVKHFKINIIYEIGVLSALMSICLLMSSCDGAKSDNNRADYSNRLMEMIHMSQDDFNDLESAFKSGDYARVEQASVAWVAYLDRTLNEIGEMEDFKGDSSLKDISIKKLIDYKDAAKDYEKLISLHMATNNGEGLDSNIETEILNSIQNKMNGLDTELREVLFNFRSSLY